MSASAVLRRLESGERWWPAEIGLRSIGTLLLGLCASLSAWLYRGLHLSPQPPGSLHYLAALSATFCWSFGWALLAEGSSLFRLVPRPRRTVLRQKSEGKSDGRSHVAGGGGGAVRAVARLCPPLRQGMRR